MENMKKTLLDLTRKVSKTSGDVIKTTKLSLNLSTEEENLKAIYTCIGKKVHEIYAYGGTLGKFFDEKYKEIQEAEQKISDLKEEIDKVKGTRTCPECGKTVNPSEFCPNCGARLDKTLVITEEKPLPPEPPNSHNKPNICVLCGTENEDSAKFCISCGRLCR